MVEKKMWSKRRPGRAGAGFVGLTEVAAIVDMGAESRKYCMPGFAIAAGKMNARR
jgi:hypothetical protein